MLAGVATQGTGQKVRTAEMLATMCLATDLGMGFPFEHGLHATLMAMRLADVLAVDSETASKTYYASCLIYAGCTTDAEISARLFTGGMTANAAPVQYASSAQMAGGIIRAMSDPRQPGYRRVYETATRLPQAIRGARPHFAAACEVAAMLAERLGLPASVSDLFAYLAERWDGKSVLRRAKGEEIPLPFRIVHVAREAAYQRLLGGDENAISLVAERAGLGLDPKVAKAFVAAGPHVLAAADNHDSVWEVTLGAEPPPWPTLDEAGVDRALAALGAFS